MQINFEAKKLREARLLVNKLESINSLSQKEHYYEKEEEPKGSFFQRLLKIIFK